MDLPGLSVQKYSAAMAACVINHVAAGYQGWRSIQPWDTSNFLGKSHAVIFIGKNQFPGVECKKPKSSPAP
jgi:hypothetical protein